MAQARRARACRGGGRPAGQSISFICAAADRDGGHFHRRGERTRKIVAGGHRHRGGGHRRAMVACAAAHRRGPQRVSARPGGWRLAARLAGASLPSHGERVRRAISAFRALPSARRRLLARQPSHARIRFFRRRHFPWLRSVARGHGDRFFRSGLAAARLHQSDELQLVYVRAGRAPRRPRPPTSLWAGAAGTSPCRGSR